MGGDKEDEDGKERLYSLILDAKLQYAEIKWEELKYVPEYYSS